MNIKERISNIYNDNKDKIIYICLAAILVLLVTLIIVILTNKNKKLEENEVTDNQISLVENMTVSEEVTPSKIMVDIKGYVENPGVYEMNITSRVNDVINASGGLISGASVKYINLSKKVFDEMVIVIYSEQEINELNYKNEEAIICLCEETKNDACIEGNYNTSEVKINDLININSSSLEELMSLPNIGESKAESIIKYREEFGEFGVIEDLMEVSGIGESVYNKIKDLITTK